MAGIKALRRIQIGRETVRGTPVPATAALLGALTMQSSPTIHRPVEERGVLAEHSRSVRVANLAELTFEGDATFEQLLYLLHMGVAGGAGVTITDIAAAIPWVGGIARVLGALVVPSPTPNGFVYECTIAGTSGTAQPTWPTVVGTTVVDGTVTWTCRVMRVWTFTPALTMPGVFDTFTMRYGDNIQAWETEHCMAGSIEIGGAMNEVMHMRADLFGRKMTPAPFTTAIVPPVVESIPMQMARLFIDPETGTIGTTERSATLISAEYRINTGLAPRRYADGSIDFSTFGETFKGVELAMTFAFNAGAETERRLFDGETIRLVRIVAEGARLGSHAPQRKQLVLDFSGIYTDFSTLEDRDGEDVVSVTMSSQRSAHYTRLFEVAVTNAVRVLP